MSTTTCSVYPLNLRYAVLCDRRPCLPTLSCIKYITPFLSPFRCAWSLSSMGTPTSVLYNDGAKKRLVKHARNTEIRGSVPSPLDAKKRKADRNLWGNRLANVVSCHQGLVDS